MFVVVAVLSLAAAIWCLRSPAHRPPLRDLLAAAPVGFLVLLPFLASGRAGILGVSVNNDMAAHLVFVEGFVSSAVEAVTPLPKDYPLGPHAMAAFLTDGFGIRPQLAFSGWTMAAALINAWTVLAIARRASWFGKAVAATVVGLPFLVAAYYGEGAFKEVLQAGLVLAVVLALSGCGPQLARCRWVPVALLLGGIVSVYSLTGLPWPLAFVGLWLAGLLAIEIWREGFRGGLRKGVDAIRSGWSSSSPSAAAPAASVPTTSATWWGCSPAGRRSASGTTRTSGCRPNPPSPAVCGRPSSSRWS